VARNLWLVVMDIPLNAGRLTADVTCECHRRFEGAVQGRIGLLRKDTEARWPGCLLQRLPAQLGALLPISDDDCNILTGHQVERLRYAAACRAGWASTMLHCSSRSSRWAICSCSCCMSHQLLHCKPCIPACGSCIPAEADKCAEAVMYAAADQEGNAAVCCTGRLRQQRFFSGTASIYTCTLHIL
jgi:hypothetical protein